MVRLLSFLLSLGVRAIRAMCRSRDNLFIESLALRQQIAIESPFVNLPQLS